MDTNRTLSDLQKLSYLKACLHGEAAQVITHLSLSSGNAVEIKMLKARCANKRRILDSHLDAIFNITRIHDESAEQLKKLIMTFDVKCLAVEALNFKVQPDLTEELDPASRRQRELESSGSTDLKSIDELRTFINCRVQSPRSSKQVQDNKEKAAEKQVYHAEKQPQRYKSSFSQCIFGSATDQLSQSSKFLAMDVNARNELVRRNKLCFNCMRKVHGTKHCKSKGSCKKCGRRHNSLLMIKDNRVLT